MKLNKKLQLGLLFTLYLTRSGRTTLASAAEGLKVSQSFLEQVARKLRLANVVKAYKGPAGGYELLGEPLVIDVFNALSPVCLLGNCNNLGHEHRALKQFATNLKSSMMPLLNRKVKNVGAELVASDNALMGRQSPSARAN